VPTDTVEFAIKAKVEIAEAERKLQEFKRKIENTPNFIKIKFDDNALNSEIRRVQQRIEAAFSSKPIKLTFDTSDLERKLGGMGRGVGGGVGAGVGAGIGIGNGVGGLGFAGIGFAAGNGLSNFQNFRNNSATPIPVTQVAAPQSSFARFAGAVGGVASAGMTAARVGTWPIRAFHNWLFRPEAQATMNDLSAGLNAVGVSVQELNIRSGWGNVNTRGILDAMGGLGDSVNRANDILTNIQGQGRQGGGRRRRRRRPPGGGGGGGDWYETSGGAGGVADAAEEAVEEMTGTGPTRRYSPGLRLYHPPGRRAARTVDQMAETLEDRLTGRMEERLATQTINIPGRRMLEGPAAPRGLLTERRQLTGPFDPHGLAMDALLAGAGGLPGPIEDIGGVPDRGSDPNVYDTYRQTFNSILNRPRRGFIFNPFGGGGGPSFGPGYGPGLGGAFRRGMDQFAPYYNRLAAKFPAPIARALPAIGAGVAIAGAMQMAGNVYNEGAQGYAYNRSLETADSFSQLNAHDLVQNNRTGAYGSGAVLRFLDKIPVVNWVTGAGESFAEGRFAKQIADERRAEEQRTRRFTNTLNTRASQRGADVLGFSTAGINSDDMFVQNTASANAQAKALENQAITAKSPEEQAALMAQANAIRASSQRGNNRTESNMIRSSALSVSISNLTGINDREAGRQGIRSGFVERLNSGTALEQQTAQREMNAALSAEDRLYKRDTGYIKGRNIAAGYAATGYNLKAQLAANQQSLTEATAGVTDRDRLNALTQGKNIADQAAVREFNLSLREMAANTRSASAALGGPNLKNALGALDAQRAVAVARNPEMAGAINASFAVQAQATQLGFGTNMAQFGMGTRGINLSNRRQGMMNSGNIIQATAQGFIDSATQQISQVNLDMQGNDPAVVAGRNARIDAIQRQAQLQVQGLKDQYRFSLRGEQVGPYEILGGAGGRDPLAQKALSDIQGLSAQMAQGNIQMNGANAPLNVGNPGGPNGAWTPSQVTQMLQWLEKIAQKVGVGP
jgi:hypothetical protein